ncbi:MAG: hypothetical protein P8H65_06085 [Rhodothermales bacterium]|nr:hypothetical protein [Rhodothermales bacterium]MDG2017317.1 hypothetical protein [Rhodothermales bacterium]
MGILEKKNRRILGLIVLAVVIVYRMFRDPVSPTVSKSTEQGEIMGSMADYALTVAGMFVLGHEVQSFQECGDAASESLWINDLTDSVEGLYAETENPAEPYDAVFGSVSMRREEAPEDGFGADYAGTAVITRINYWPLEGFNCAYDWDAFDFQAFGNEPFWRARLAEGKVVLTTPEGEQTFEVDAHRWPLSNTDKTFVLSASDEECRDTMTGTFYGESVELFVGESRWKGCGHWGLGK